MNAQIWLNLERLDARENAPLRGFARLESKDQFRVEGFRLEINLKESWDETGPTPSWDTMGSAPVRVASTLYSKDVPISKGPFEMRQGEKREFPFEVEVPVFSPTHGGSITYCVKAVANVKWRPDVTKEAELTR